MSNPNSLTGAPAAAYIVWPDGTLETTSQPELVSRGRMENYIPFSEGQHGLKAYNVWLEADSMEVNEDAPNLLGLPDAADIIGSVLLIQKAPAVEPLDRRVAAALAGDAEAMDEFNLVPGLTEQQQQQALVIIARWMGRQLGYDGPAPTGQEAYENGTGITLDPRWAYREDKTPVPTIFHEGSHLDDWAIHASLDDEVLREMLEIKVFCEPITSYALGLYPDRFDEGM